jgi:hypothetical protein
VIEAGGDRGHAGEAARHGALPVAEDGAAAPRDYGAVDLQGEAVTVAGGDRGHAGEAARHVALAIVEAAAPGDDGPICLQGETMNGPGVDRGRAGEAARDGAVAASAAAAAPGEWGGGRRLRRPRRDQNADAEYGQRAEPEEQPRSRRQLDPLVFP